MAVRNHPRSRRAEPISRSMLDFELEKRKKHLAPHMFDYKRVFNILFSSIIDPLQADLKTKVYSVRYKPNSRFMEIGVAWEKDQRIGRSGGFFGLWRDGLFFSHEIETYPKMVCRVENYRTIGSMNDHEIVEAILDRIGAPFADRFPVPPETGAFRRETRRLLDCIKTLQTIAPEHYQQEVADLQNRIGGFGEVVGA